MMARRRLGGFALAVALGLIAVARAAPAQWETYTKPHFGTIADYPVDLLTVQLPPPENRDGASFCTTDGRAQLSIYGAYNVDSDMPQSYVAKFDPPQRRRLQARDSAVLCRLGDKRRGHLLRAVQLPAP